MSTKICTVILAGGLGRRMDGQDKGLLEWQGKPLNEHVLTSLDYNDDIIINANRNQQRYQSYGYPVINDSIADYQGPLVGILSAMSICQNDYLLCLPCDSPHPPTELKQRLMNCLQQNQNQCAICHDGTRLQPLFALIACSYQEQLQSFLDQGQRKVHDFFLQLKPAICDFSDQPDHFHNFNTPNDMR